MRPHGRQSSPGLAEAPIGVFDSGIGGLSVLRALRAEMPREHFVYFDDSRHAPYGERDDAHVVARSRAIGRYLVGQHHIKALVVACNTATAAAVELLRAEHPGLPIVGVEPALKPAVLASRTKHIGVMATRSTLASAKFQALHTALHGQAHFALQACDGLADAIGQSAETGDMAPTAELCATYLGAMGLGSDAPGGIDTLVLGCTHYVLAQAELAALAGPQVRILSTGEPVARRTRDLLQQAGALASALAYGPGHGSLQLVTTGAPATLQAAALRWLNAAPGQAIHCAA